MMCLYIGAFSFFFCSVSEASSFFSEKARALPQLTIPVLLKSYGLLWSLANLLISR